MISRRHPEYKRINGLISKRSNQSPYIMPLIKKYNFDITECRKHIIPIMLKWLKDKFDIDRTEDIWNALDTIIIGDFIKKGALRERMAIEAVKKHWIKKYGNLDDFKLDWDTSMVFENHGIDFVVSGNYFSVKGMMYYTDEFYRKKIEYQVRTFIKDYNYTDKVTVFCVDEVNKIVKGFTIRDKDEQCA